MPYETWFLLANSVKVGDKWGSLVVRRRSDDNNVEVAGEIGDRNVLRVVMGNLGENVYVVTSLSEEFTDEVTEYDSYLSDLWSAWGGQRYNIIDELQPHVEKYIEM